MLTASDVRKIAKRQAARDRLSYSRDDLDDVTQDTVLGILEFLKDKDSVELSELQRVAERTARQSWQRIRAESPIRLGDSADTLSSYLRTVELADTEVQDSDKPEWIPSELWPVARLVASGWRNREIGRELGVNEITVRRHRARLALLPVPFRQWATAQSERRKAHEGMPDYSRIASTPKALGDIPPNVAKPDCGDDQIHLLSDRHDELGKAIWEGLTCAAFHVSTQHGLRHDCRLMWGENWSTCGVGVAAQGM